MAAESRAQWRQQVIALLDEGKRIMAKGKRNLTDADWHRIKTVLDAAVGLAKRTRDDELTAQALRTAAEAYIYVTHDHTEALRQGCKYAQELLARDTRRKASRRLIAEDLEMIGWSLYYLKEKDWQERAPQYVRQALELAKQAGDKPGVARCCEKLGIIYAYMGNYEQGAEFWGKATSAYEGLDNKWRVARAKANVGQLLFELGEHESGLKVLFEALDLAEAIHPHLTPGDQYGNQMTMNECWGGLGDFYFRYAQYPKALEYFQQAAKGMERIEFGPSAIMHARAAECYVAMDKAEEAERQYAEIFSNEGFGKIKEMADRWQSEAVFLSYGNYLFTKGEGDRALDYFRRALDPIDRQGREQDRADCFIRMGNVYLAQKKFQNALEHFDESLRVLEKLWLPELAWQAHQGRGLALEGLGREEEARQEYEKAIDILERLALSAMQESERKIALRAARVEPFHAALRLAFKRGDIAGAFQRSEQAKARTLLNALASGRVNITKGMTDAEKEEERHFQRRRTALRLDYFRALSEGEAGAEKEAALRKDLTELEGAYRTFRDRVYAAHPELKALQGRVEPIGYTQLTNLARAARLVILDYVVTKDAAHVFVITPSGVKLHKLRLTQDELQRMMGELREKYTYPTRRPFPMIAWRLYNRLVRPVESELAGAETVCIIPDGELAELPFHALVRRVGGREEYVVQSWAVVYAPSVSVLHWLVQNHPTIPLPHHLTTSPLRHTHLVAFGDPNYPQPADSRDSRGYQLRGYQLRGLKLTPLPGTRREVKAIAKLYGTQARVWLGKEATEPLAKWGLGQCRIAHFAAHGHYDFVDPMASGVLLAQAPSGSDDGFLEAREIANLNVSAELVTLSACETGQGRVTQGEGLIGLTWSLFAAGAPAAVVTQWEVNDASTEQLMQAFYRNLQSGMTKSQALRQAQLSLIHGGRYAHPYYWAPFMVTGLDAPLYPPRSAWSRMAGWLGGLIGLLLIVGGLRWAWHGRRNPSKAK